MVEHLHAELYGLPVPSCQVWTVHLKQKAGVVYGVVLLFHGIAHSVNVGFMAAVVPVLMVIGDVPGRGGRHEHIIRFNSHEGGIEVGYVSIDSAAVLPGDRPSTGRPPHTPATACGPRVVLWEVYRFV